MKETFRIPFYRRLFFKLIASSTVIVIFCVLLINAFFISIIYQGIRDNFAKNTILVAQEKISEIEANVSSRVKFIDAYTHRRAVKDFLISSNNDFSLFEDQENYIAQYDAEWKENFSNPEYEFAQAIEENPISKDLLEMGMYLEDTYGYPVFVELFVTNKYGVNIAETNRTSDYYQADEAWWQKAVAGGFYIGKSQYDPSAGVTSIEIAIPIVGDSELLGVLKAVLNIEDVTHILANLVPTKEAHEAEKHKAHGHLSHNSMHYMLLDSEGDIISMTQGASDYSRSDVLGESDMRVWDDIDHYFFVTSEEGEEDLVVLAHSNNETVLLGWTLVLQHGVDEVFQTLDTVRNRFLGSVIFVSLLATVFGMLSTQRSIIRPIQELTSAAQRVAENDFGTEVRTKAKGEIGLLASVFNTMAQKIRKSHLDMEQEVVRRTQQLQETKEDLEQKVHELEKFKELMVDRELKMIALKSQVDSIQKGNRSLH